MMEKSQIQYFYQMSGMKGESLLSNLSNVSYNFEGGEYGGSDFFKESLLVKKNNKNSKCQEREEIGIDSLAMSAVGNLSGIGESVGAFTLCWTNDGKNAAEGVSDEQVDLEQNQKVKKEESEEKLEVQSQKEESSKENKPKLSRFKNETKNIPKNYGKAIIIFIEKNPRKIHPILTHYNVEYNSLLQELQERKKSINTIADLRKMWMEFKYCEVIRVVSLLFFRKYSLPYIFNSRIKSRECHVKYKRRLQEALANPGQFQHIKDY